MSKYQIKHACGCIVTHNICGTDVHGERQRKADWLATQLCYECYKKEQTEKAKESNKDLPSLNGTEKQIAWAESIRAEKIKQLKQTIDKNINKEGELFEKFEKIVNDEVINNTSAKYWIDNRDKTFDVYFLNKLCKDKL
jgi:hypothetical protein|nr:MAG TPA: hypothetical protein [Caudoviricetes sp.]